VEPQISDNGGDGMIGDCRSAIADLRLVEAPGQSIMEYTPNAPEERLMTRCGYLQSRPKATQRRQQGQPAG
jgi:hypothetical protein